MERISEIKPDNKLHVVNSFQDAKDESYVPSVEMLKRFLFNNVFNIDCFSYDNGYLYVNSFGNIDGVEYIIQNNEFVVNVDENNTTITDVRMNNYKELEMII